MIFWERGALGVVANDARTRRVMGAAGIVTSGTNVANGDFA